MSADRKVWGRPVAQGSWANDALPKTVFWPKSNAQFVKLLGLNEVNSQPLMSIAELEVLISFAESPQLAAK